MSKILLHACCGPCSLEPVRLLQEEGHELAIYFYNPNIHPAEEYQHRLQTLHQWADPAGVQVIEGPYDPRAWEQSVGTLHREGCPMQERCRACYRMRLQKTAEAATELGFEALSSTLNVSPYQFNDIIHEETDRAAEAAGLESVFRDFRPAYPEATRRSRELGMYRQKFCGCHYSKDEAESQRREREERKAAEKARRAADEAVREQERAAKRAAQEAYDRKQQAKKAARKAAKAAAMEEAAKASEGITR